MKLFFSGYIEVTSSGIEKRHYIQKYHAGPESPYDDVFTTNIEMARKFSSEKRGLWVAKEHVPGKLEVFTEAASQLYK